MERFSVLGKLMVFNLYVSIFGKGAIWGSMESLTVKPCSETNTAQPGLFFRMSMRTTRLLIGGGIADDFSELY